MESSPFSILGLNAVEALAGNAHIRYILFFILFVIIYHAPAYSESFCHLLKKKKEKKLLHLITPYFIEIKFFSVNYNYHFYLNFEPNY